MVYVRFGTNKALFGTTVPECPGTDPLVLPEELAELRRPGKAEPVCYLIDGQLILHQKFLRFKHQIEIHPITWSPPRCGHDTYVEIPVRDIEHVGIESQPMFLPEMHFQQREELGGEIGFPQGTAPLFGSETFPERSVEQGQGLEFGACQAVGIAGISRNFTHGPDIKIKTSGGRGVHRDDRILYHRSPYVTELYGTVIQLFHKPVREHCSALHGISVLYVDADELALEINDQAVTVDGMPVPIDRYRSLPLKDFKEGIARRHEFVFMDGIQTEHIKKKDVIAYSMVFRDLLRKHFPVVNLLHLLHGAVRLCRITYHMRVTVHPRKER